MMTKSKYMPGGRGSGSQRSSSDEATTCCLGFSLFRKKPLPPTDCYVPTDKCKTDLGQEFIPPEVNPTQASISPPQVEEPPPSYSPPEDEMLQFQGSSVVAGATGGIDPRTDAMQKRNAKELIVQEMWAQQALKPPSKHGPPRTQAPANRIVHITDHYNGVTYRRGKLLGKGGFARCYELTEVTSSRIYAGKIISKARLSKPRQRDKILREVELHRILQHTNVVEFHSFFEDDLNMYMVLENCSRKSLVHVLGMRKNLTEPEVRYYMRQLINGCRYIHSKRIVHRDLKLGNMLINDQMQMKIADFGLATRIEYEGEKKMTVCGTPNYIAPEVLQKLGHSYEADVWAHGCVMYALIVGSPPFETSTLQETYSRIARNQYQVPGSVSQPARRLITRFLAADPADRPKLDGLVYDDFFTSGYSPGSLSPSACDTAPWFPAHILPPRPVSYAAPLSAAEEERAIREAEQQLYKPQRSASQRVGKTKNKENTPSTARSKPTQTRRGNLRNINEEDQQRLSDLRTESRLSNREEEQLVQSVVEIEPPKQPLKRVARRPPVPIKRPESAQRTRQETEAGAAGMGSGMARAGQGGAVENSPVRNQKQTGRAAQMRENVRPASLSNQADMREIATSVRRSSSLPPKPKPKATSSRDSNSPVHSVEHIAARRRQEQDHRLHRKSLSDTAANSLRKSAEPKSLDSSGNGDSTRKPSEPYISDSYHTRGSNSNHSSRNNSLRQPYVSDSYQRSHNSSQQSQGEVSQSRRDSGASASQSRNMSGASGSQSRMDSGASVSKSGSMSSSRRLESNERIADRRILFESNDSSMGKRLSESGSGEGVDDEEEEFGEKERSGGMKRLTKTYSEGKACSAIRLYKMLSHCLEVMPADSSPTPIPNCNPLWVTKWVDYSNKYGFGFQFSDRSVGILFNDTTRMVLSPDGSTLVYNDLSNKTYLFTTDTAPAEQRKKVTLLIYFSQYMDEHLISGIEVASHPYGYVSAVYMKKWFRTDRAIVMHLNNGTLQVNFFEDHTKLILSVEGQGYIVTYIDADRRSVTYRLLQLEHFGCNELIEERLRYALRMLEGVINFEGESV